MLCSRADPSERTPPVRVPMSERVAIMPTIESEGDITGIEELRAEALGLVVFTMAMVAFFGHMLLAASTQKLDLARFGYMWLLLAIAGLSYRTLRRGSAPAAACLVTSLTA